MDWIAFTIGFGTALGLVLIYHTGRAAERIALRKRWQDGESRD